MTQIPRLMSLMTGDEKHSSAATSTLDVIRVLYERVLDVSPETIGDERRDRFYLSKGHGPMAYYAVLADHGFFPESWLSEWGSFDSPLGFHPDRNLVPGVEISSGSLGHGLPLAVGTALGLRAQGIGSRVVVLVGDAELDEGSNHEALELAVALALDALTVVVVDNRSSSYAVPAASPSGSRSRAGTRRRWTDATTTPSRRCSRTARSVSPTPSSPTSRRSHEPPRAVRPHRW
jgi:transketolase